MIKVGQELTEAIQEMLDHASGKIELRTTQLSVALVPEEISADEIKEMPI